MIKHQQYGKNFSPLLGGPTPPTAEIKLMFPLLVVVKRKLRRRRLESSMGNWKARWMDDLVKTSLHDSVSG